MKMLLSTTALVFALGAPAMTTAQSATTNSAEQDAGMSGFLNQRSQSDLFASELMGHEVYASRSASGTMPSDDDAMTDEDGTRTMMMMNRSDLDDMESIGEVNEIVLSSDGQVLALVIGAGGFLGMGEHDIAVTMDQITIASDADDRSETYIVLNTSADMLRDSPSYDRTAMMSADDDQQTDEARSERSPFSAPELERDGYERVGSTDVSTDVLMDKSVYDVDDNDVGNVTDMIINDSGEITNVIIDFGGFLGIGSSQASLRFDELTIITTEDYGDVRIYVDATRDQIQNLPEYHASN